MNIEEVTKLVIRNTKIHWFVAFAMFREARILGFIFSFMSDLLLLFG